MKAIPFKKLAHQAHTSLLEDLETMADKAYSHIAGKMVAEIVAVLKKQKLAKSDDLKRGWTGQVPKIEINMADELINSTLDRYLDALKYVLLGKLAGPAAVRAAKAIGIADKIIPGIVPAAYLDSVDTHREHYKDLYGEDARTMSKDLMKGSLNEIKRRTTKFIDESLLRLRNRITEALELQMQMINGQTLAQAHEEAHDTSLDEAVQKVLAEEFRPARSEFAEAMTEATDAYQKDWKRMVQADTGLASAIATHQAVTEIYGAGDDDVRVAFVAMRDEKTCQFCKRVSRDEAGEFKLYRIGDFKPAGYNYGKKHEDWDLCIPPAHPNCRCNLVYVPRGFTINKSGSVSVEKKP